MKCNKDQLLGCRYCPETACSGLSGFSCIECMETHLLCAWYMMGVDFRIQIKRLKDKYKAFCKKCEDKLKYGEKHICKIDCTVDWLDIMRRLPTKKDKKNG